MEDKYKKVLNSRALKYLEKRNYLKPSVIKHEIEEDDNQEKDPNINLEEEIHDQVEEQGVKDNAIRKAKLILNSFPLDKSKYSPKRVFTPENTIFEDSNDIDQILNSLVFTTKLSFFDNSKKSEEVLKEISEDSFGYMNLLRKNQISLIERETAKIHKRKTELSKEQFKKNIVEFRNIKIAENTNAEKYLDKLINFYAANVFGKGKTTKEIVIKINLWLDQQI